MISRRQWDWVSIDKRIPPQQQQLAASMLKTLELLYIDGTIRLTLP
jgi:hypothetical protein